MPNREAEARAPSLRRLFLIMTEASDAEADAEAGPILAFRNLIRSLPLQQEERARLLECTQLELQTISDDLPSIIQEHFPPHAPPAAAAASPAVQPGCAGAATQSPSSAGLVMRHFFADMPLPSAFCDNPYQRDAFMRRVQTGPYQFHMTAHGRAPFPPQLRCPARFGLCQLIGMYAAAAASVRANQGQELDLSDALRGILAKLLQVRLEIQSIPGTWGDSLADLVYAVPDDEDTGEMPALIVVVKPELDEGAAYQLAAYYVGLWAAKARGACPSFLIQVCGGHVSLSCAITTAKGIIIEELTPAVGVLPYADPTCLRPAFRLFGALRKTLPILTKSLQSLARRHCGGTRLAFPFSLCQDIPVQIHTQIYETLCFRATVSPATPVILKIARGRYGLHAHIFAMRQGFAPPLLACYRLPEMASLLLASGEPAEAEDPVADYLVVVMAEVPFTPWSQMSIEQRQAQEPALRQAVRTLHESDYVHGDLRRCNVGLIDAPLAPHLGIIDYDWAGRNSSACYPPFINHRIAWPKGKSRK
ncbi:hypothetical protein PAPYR_7378 [Paratrimastix pyriformis]|uniref:Protein kinase domain-containing protein n=1 Tax=Paratrimastix pyriformis TaxID=342808 RepID=A0ABQ8UD48_9EUKA|nr:hypothetical protein PAPYR_7378 [Paratrimastix pyriformis]